VTERLGALQISIDAAAAGEEDRRLALHELIDSLTTRYGRDHVRRFDSGDKHHPEHASFAIPANTQPNTEPAWQVPAPDEPPLRPLRLFDPPQPIETIAEVPDGPPIRFRWRHVLHHIVRAEGPERIAPEWWGEKPSGPTRDYYRVEDGEGRRFWIVRRGLYGDAAASPRWFLHGIFA
jgi:protein ImuB